MGAASLADLGRASEQAGWLLLTSFAQALEDSQALICA
jgi:hypothetical protein